MYDFVTCHTNCRLDGGLWMGDDDQPHVGMRRREQKRCAVKKRSARSRFWMTHVLVRTRFQAGLNVWTIKESIHLASHQNTEPTTQNILYHRFCPIESIQTDHNGSQRKSMLFGVPL